MNPFRYLPRSFLALMIFVVLPLLASVIFSDDPAAKIDCDAPDAAKNERICALGPNLARAQDAFSSGVEELRRAAQ